MSGEERSEGYAFEALPRIGNSSLYIVSLSFSVLGILFGLAALVLYVTRWNYHPIRYQDRPVFVMLVLIIIMGNTFYATAKVFIETPDNVVSLKQFCSIAAAVSLCFALMATVLFMRVFRFYFRFNTAIMPTLAPRKHHDFLAKRPLFKFLSRYPKIFGSRMFMYAFLIVNLILLCICGFYSWFEFPTRTALDGENCLKVNPGMAIMIGVMAIYSFGAITLSITMRGVSDAFKMKSSTNLIGGFNLALLIIWALCELFKAIIGTPFLIPNPFLSDTVESFGLDDVAIYFVALLQPLSMLVAVIAMKAEKVDRKMFDSDDQAFERNPILKLMEVEEATEKFTKYCITEYCAENIEFAIAMRSVAKVLNSGITMENTQIVLKEAKHIEARFVKQGSPFQINIIMGLRKDFQDALRSLSEVFDASGELLRIGTIEEEEHSTTDSTEELVALVKVSDSATVAPEELVVAATAFLAIAKRVVNEVLRLLMPAYCRFIRLPENAALEAEADNVAGIHALQNITDKESARSNSRGTGLSSTGKSQKISGNSDRAHSSYSSE